jgi:prepilin-type N-terminal cleavage/methylation domain-containing protein/prepilin-type processing-associated H-X9-DG protein
MSASSCPANRRRAAFAPGKAAAFTLIELLVVVAIIAILAAILFPVFAQARGKARQTVCLSAMKQIGHAIVMYSQDYDEMLVPGNVGGGFSLSYFDFLLDPYVKSRDVWNCPEATNGTAVQIRTVGMNEAVAIPLGRFGNRYPALSIAEVQEPAQLLVMSDSLPNPWNGDGSFGTGSFGQAFQACRAALAEAAGPVSVNAPANRTISPYLRHNFGANYAYADGHAKWNKPRNTLVPNVLWFTNKPALAAIPANCNDVTALRPPAP